jgi:hypothetical protein
MPDWNASGLYRTEPAARSAPVVRVNGAAAKAAARNGYAVLDRTWKAGDRVEFEAAVQPARVRPSAKVEALKGRVALRHGPLIYNIEARDQELGKALPAKAALRAEWRADLLGGVMTLRSEFADGSPLMAVPNYARMNRETPSPLPPAAPPPGPDGRRPAPPPVKSAVWIEES